MHYRDQNFQFTTLTPLTHYTDVARVFFQPQDFEMWDTICQSNMQHSQLQILEFNRELMLKQGKIFEAIQAEILIDEYKKDELFPER